MYRSIYCKIFDDPDYQALDKNSRLVLLTLRLCEASGPCAIFRYYKGVIAEQTGLTETEVLKAFDTLSHTHWIAYDKAIVWVRNGLKYEPSMTISNSKHLVSIKKHLSSLPKSEIVLNFCKHYGIDKSFLPYAIGYDIPIRYPMASTEPEPDTDTEYIPPLPPTGGNGQVFDFDPIAAPPDQVSISNSGTEIPNIGEIPEEIFGASPKPGLKAEKKNELLERFENFWAEYPRREARIKALKAWNRLKPSEATLAKMLEALKIDKISKSWTKNDGEFIPLPASWLNGERWKDERKTHKNQKDESWWGDRDVAKPEEVES